jgi:pimeloyl-ACP methyl ester carboxylesterase
MTLSPAPKLLHPQKQASRVRPGAAACHETEGIRCFAARDGVQLSARLLDAGSSETLVLFLYGVLASSAKHSETARLLHETLGATVVSLDLRGHGHSEGTPGDVDHIGQYEDDVADVVATLRRERPGARICSPVTRWAAASRCGMPTVRLPARASPAWDGYLLFAPLLGHESPTERRPEPDAKPSQDALIKVHVPRLIGLVMLNAVGVRALNALPTLFFDIPAALPTAAYSFRAMLSMAPPDFRAALTADAKPMLVVVGENDEAFLAEEFPSVISAHVGGRTMIVPGESHDGVTESVTAFASVKQWAAEWAAIR